MDVGFDFDEQVEKLANVPKAIRLAVVVALLLCVGSGFYMLSYQDSRAEAVQLRGQAEELQRKLNKVRVVASNLAEFEQEVADLERELEVALKQLPNRKQFEDLLRDISTAGKQVGVEIKSIKRMSEKSHGFYAEVPFQIELEGSYHDVAKFFERLSRLPRIVNVGSLSVRAPKKRGGQMLLRVKGTATTFRFLSKQADTAAVTLPDGSGRA